MKKLPVIILSIICTGHLLAQDINPDEIISQNLKAIGQEKLMSSQTIKITGKMSQGGLEFAMTNYEKKPDITRLDIEVQGMSIIMVVNGNTGWTINPATGSFDPQDLPAEMINSLKEESQSDPVMNWENPFFNWKEDGTIAEFAGKENIDGIPVYNLKFTFKNSDIVNYYLDASKFVVLRQRSVKTVQGQTFDQEARYSDFRDIQGIVYPAKTEILINGQSGTVVVIDKCELDIPINDSIFIKPLPVKN